MICLEAVICGRLGGGARAISSSSYNKNTFSVSVKGVGVGVTYIDVVVGCDGGVEAAHAVAPVDVLVEGAGAQEGLLVFIRDFQRLLRHTRAPLLNCLDLSIDFWKKSEIWWLQVAS